MFLAVKEVARRRLIKRIVWISLSALAIGGATVALARLKPAAPSVDMSGQTYRVPVKRGPMERQVRGLGRLTPKEIHWIAAAKDARVAQIVRRPGLDPVKATDVILVLADPDLVRWMQRRPNGPYKQEESNLDSLKGQAGGN